MPLITNVQEPNIWEEICKEFSAKRPPFKDDDIESVHTVLEDYDAAKHTPVFFGKLHKKVAVDQDVVRDLDPAISHPAVAGFAFLDRPPKSPPPSPPPPPSYKTCLPREYLEHHIFPVLLPILEEMLKEAKKERCFERKRTKFNAMDFLTEHLYKNNPRYPERKDSELMDIPFVQEWLKDHPRAPLPKSLLWTEEEATLKLQAHWRGYKARLDPEIQDLRQWQREWREENRNIASKVEEFWADKMPENSEDSSTADHQVAGEDGSVEVDDSVEPTLVNEDEPDKNGVEVDSVEDVIQEPECTGQEVSQEPEETVHEVSQEPEETLTEQDGNQETTNDENI